MTWYRIRLASYAFVSILNVIAGLAGGCSFDKLTIAALFAALAFIEAANHHLENAVALLLRNNEELRRLLRWEVER